MPARLTFALLTLALLTSVPLGAQAEEWTVYAGVVDRSGAPVPGLSATDFVVRENGQTREILRVSQATDSLRVAAPKTLIPPKTIDVGVRRADVVVRAPRVF